MLISNTSFSGSRLPSWEKTEASVLARQSFQYPMVKPSNENALMGRDFSSLCVFRSTSFLQVGVRSLSSFSVLAV